MMGNNADADFFISFHRNATGVPEKSTGIETLVFQDSGIKAEMARNINRELANLGFEDRGVIERPNLVVLKRTKMPALLIEAGFIDTFRHFYPDVTEAYSWWSYRFRAREKNAGWRIDYFCVSEGLEERLAEAVIHTDIYGSDHCPVGLYLE